jgi:hypothetical protein
MSGGDFTYLSERFCGVAEETERKEWMQEMCKEWREG